MKLNERFVLQEYVSKATYEKYGDKAIRFISTALIEADLKLVLALEEHFKRPISCTINSWYFGGKRQYSGLRVEGEPHYRWSSLHSMGAASDKQFKFKDTGEPMNTREVYAFIRQFEDMFYDLGIRRMENIKDAPNWIHWDTCWTGENYRKTIQIVNG